MKILPHITLTITLIISTLSTPTFAQKMKNGVELPDGAAARLGNGFVYDIQYTEDGTRLAVATSMGIWIYDTINYKKINLLTNHSTRSQVLAVSPNGNTMASVDTNSIIYLWDINTGERKLELNNSGGITEITFNRNGDTLATLGTRGTVRLWDPNTGREKQVSKNVINLHKPFIYSTALSQYGFMIATGDKEGTIRVLDSLSNTNIHTFEAHQAIITSLSFNTDGNILASGSWNDSIRLWDIVEGKQKLSIDGTIAMHNLTFNPTGDLLASSGPSGPTYNIYLWDINTGEKWKELKGHTGHVLDIAFSSDLRTVASAAMDGTVRIWEVVSGQQKHIFPFHYGNFTCFGISPDDKTVIAPTHNQTVCLWDIKSGQLVKTVGKESHHTVAEIAFNPTANVMATGSHGKFINVWNRETFELMDTFRWHKDLVSSIAYSPDGKTLVSGSKDKTVRLWDTDTLEEKHRLERHESGVTSVAFSPDGMTVASASNDRTVRLWDAETGGEKKVLEGHETGVTDVVFSPNGTTIASTDNTVSLFLWDAKTGDQTGIIDVEPPGARCIDFSPDSKVLVVGTLAGAVQLIDIATGVSLHKFQGHNKNVTVTDIEFTSDGDKVVSRYDDGVLYVWNVGAFISP
ncbi:hypothetical protein F4212_06790 [Candidatus Poribacteria bacterium]|nr:hypothetical protein [Candidatus Poribacteria bacterium]